MSPSSPTFREIERLTRRGGESCWISEREGRKDGYRQEPETSSSAEEEEGWDERGRARVRVRRERARVVGRIMLSELRRKTG